MKQQLGRLLLMSSSEPVYILNRRFTAAGITALEPSKVLHFRNLGFTVNETDVRELVQPFGSATKVVKMKEQLLMQMQDLEQATSIIEHFATEQAAVRGRKIYVKYSIHQELRRPEEQPGKILFAYIVNPMYAINVPVIYRVFSPMGKIEKMVISEKSGTVAMIQFDCEESATKAKNYLDGREIFDGCCKLEITYSRFEDLGLSSNSNMARDFTMPTSKPGFEKSILGAGYMREESAPVAENGFMAGITAYTGCNRQRILLAGHLNPEMIEEDKLFNLFSPYGIVLRIKIFSARDQALVEMHDGFQAELAMNYLKGTILFGKRLELRYSKQSHLNNPLTRNYTGDQRGRFFPEFAKNCCASTNVLHAACLPSDIEKQELIKYFAPHTVRDVRILDSQSKFGKKQALLEFVNIESAVQVLVTKQFSLLKDSLIRLSFSMARLVPEEMT